MKVEPWHGLAVGFHKGGGFLGGREEASMVDKGSLVVERDNVLYGKRKSKRVNMSARDEKQI